MEPFRYHRSGFSAKQVNRAYGAARGFTLIELLVVLAIIVILSAIVLTSQSTFNKTIVLANTAYDVALTLRATETYGIGNRAVGSTANVGYGLDFQNTTPKSFTLFADVYPAIGSTGPFCHAPIGPASGPGAVPGNCVYDQGQGEKVTDYTLGNGITINDFCGYSPTNQSWSCANSGNQKLAKLDIVFSRPNPDPSIMMNDSSQGGGPVPASIACLVLSSSSGGSRYVSVTASGEITTATSSCP